MSDLLFYATNCALFSAALLAPLLVVLALASGHDRMRARQHARPIDEPSGWRERLELWRRVESEARHE